MNKHAAAEQLSLLPASSVHARFRLNRTTRERGLRHVAEIREMLAQRQAERDAAATVVPMRPALDRAA